jgi:hypothetical protein
LGQQPGQQDGEEQGVSFYGHVEGSLCSKDAIPVWACRPDRDGKLISTSTGAPYTSFYIVIGPIAGFAVSRRTFAHPCHCMISIPQ